jgi:acyl-CoA synthetase (AMP-forming)/AMP-acid ligase II
LRPARRAFFPPVHHRGVPPDQARMAAQIRAHRVDAVVASPAIAAKLAAQAGASAPFDSVRRVVLGGAPVLPPLLDRWRDAAPGAKVTALYGATEAEPIASLRADDYGDAERHATSDGAGVLAGWPARGADVRVLPDRHGTAIRRCSEAELAASFVAPGVEGEIAVAGPHVARGYLAQIGDALSGIETELRHWHRTGDAGYFDTRGRLWLTGRCANRIELAGVATHPLRVEAALAGHPGVAHAALLQRGDRRILVIEPAGRAIGDEALDRISARVAFAAPDDVAIVDRMPVDVRHGAKVDYRRLADDIAAGRVRSLRGLAELRPASSRRAPDRPA